jgi:hypothetical protein
MDALNIDVFNFIGGMEKCNSEIDFFSVEGLEKVADNASKVAHEHAHAAGEHAHAAGAHAGEHKDRAVGAHAGKDKVKA